MRWKGDRPIVRKPDRPKDKPSMSEPAEPDVNPYASPLSDCPRADRVDEGEARRQMLAAIRLYWWMGVVGAGAYSVVAIGFVLVWVARGKLPAAEEVLGLATMFVSIAPFAWSIAVANRLATRPEGMLRPARWVGILLGTIWFPILTIPAVLCVRRVTRYYRVYCGSNRSEMAH